MYYNRFRYYAPDEGIYISQDPIKFASGEANFYAYIQDVNSWIDPFGLNGEITVLRFDTSFGSGNHYKLLYNDVNGVERITDLSESGGKTKVRDMPNTKSFDEIDKKQLKFQGI